MSLGDLPSTSSEFRIGGRASSNCTSTTAPITAMILPTAPGAAAGAAEPAFGAAADAAAAADTGLSVETYRRLSGGGKLDKNLTIQADTISSCKSTKNKMEAHKTTMKNGWRGES